MNIILLLGPGRCGTTSLYYSFKQTNSYHVSSEKEDGLFSFGFNTERKNSIQKCKSVFVDCNPTNLLYANQILNNLSNLSCNEPLMVLIDRPPKERIISLYKFHRLAGRISSSFDEYVSNSVRIAAEWGGEYMSDSDLIYGGLAEYDERVWSKLDDMNNFSVISYDNLFYEMNEVLSSMDYTEIEEVKRNQSFTPKSKIIHSLLLKTNQSLPKSGRIRRNLADIYKKLNAKNNEKISISPETLQTLNMVQKGYDEKLKKIQSNV